MIAQVVLDQIEAELAQADIARAAGYEGKARVCARRAAGMAIRAYLQDRGVASGSVSAYNLIQTLRDLPETPAEIRRVAEHLLERVNPDFKLSTPVDLLAEARWLVKYLNEV